MSESKFPVPADFPILLKAIKNRILQAQTRATFAVNAELVQLYWDIGRMIAARQRQEGWGAGVIPRLARELANELPEMKGFSERNIGRMIAFSREYPDPTEILPQTAAKLDPHLKYTGRSLRAANSFEDTSSPRGAGSAISKARLGTAHSVFGASLSG